MNKNSIRMLLLALLLSVGMTASISYANAAKQTPDPNTAMKAQTKTDLLDINSATKDQLTSLPAIDNLLRILVADDYRWPAVCEEDRPRSQEGHSSGDV